MTVSEPTSREPDDLTQRAATAAPGEVVTPAPAPAVDAQVAHPAVTAAPAEVVASAPAPAPPIEPEVGGAPQLAGPGMPYPVPVAPQPVTGVPYPVVGAAYPVSAPGYPVSGAAYPVSAPGYPVTGMPYAVAPQPARRSPWLVVLWIATGVLLLGSGALGTLYYLDHNEATKTSQEQQAEIRDLEEQLAQVQEDLEDTETQLQRAEDDLADARACPEAVQAFLDLAVDVALQGQTNLPQAQAQQAVLDLVAACGVTM